MYEITDRYEYEEEIKKSRFHVISMPVKSIEEAMSFFQENSIPAANHNCWAYKVGDDYRLNDDGEPSGTAGKPILSAIEFADITNIAVLIVRWFGGTKLGTGGLCRAYGGTTGKCLKLAEKVEIIEKIEVSIAVPFDLNSLLYHLLETATLPKIHEEYGPNGLSISTVVPKVDLLDFEQTVLNATHGKAIFKAKNESS